MKVDFYTGVVPIDEDRTRDAYWARTPFGVIALLGDGPDLIDSFDPESTLSDELFTSLDLPGLDREGVIVIVTNILKRGYLKKPELHNKGEAILFVLVNEAIHQLSAIMREEDAL